MSLATSRILDLFRSRTGKSAALARRARNVFPGGVTHDGRFLKPYPIYVERAAGSRKWDVDGNEYVDYAGGHGALLLGHCHPQVTEAVQMQLARGTHFGSCHELEVEWGAIIQRLVPSAELVRFTSSGTEATMLALRLARAYSNRPKIVRFAGHFHGWHDHLAFGYSSHFDGSPTPGVLSAVADNVIVAPAGDEEATRAILDGHDDVAAVIIEPTGGSWGQAPLPPEFLQQLRRMTAPREVVLIFDEVISGFRCSPGGAQAHFGVTPDLTTLAKIVAGGLPGGALVGRREIMETLDQDASTSLGREKIAHHGTFNANPLSAAAGQATLQIVAETDACGRANDYAASLRRELNDVLASEGVDWAVYGTFSGFHIFTNPEHKRITADDILAAHYDCQTLKARDPQVIMKLRVGMLAHGVELFSWPGGLISSVHTDDDLQRTVEAFRSTLRLMKDDGDIET